MVFYVEDYAYPWHGYAEVRGRPRQMPDRTRPDKRPFQSPRIERWFRRDRALSQRPFYYIRVKDLYSLTLPPVNINQFRLYPREPDHAVVERVLVSRSLPNQGVNFSTLYRPSVKGFVPPVARPRAGADIRLHNGKPVRFPLVDGWDGDYRDPSPIDAKMNVQPVRQDDLSINFPHMVMLFSGPDQMKFLQSKRGYFIISQQEAILQSNGQVILDAGIYLYFPAEHQPFGTLDYP